MTANKPYNVNDQLSVERQELEERIQLIKQSGKFISNEEIVLYIRWRYRKSRTWVYKYILKNIKWYTRPTITGAPPLKYLTYEDCRQQIERLMG